MIHVITRFNKNTSHPYGIQFQDTLLLPVGVLAWCKEQFKDDNWRYLSRSIWFNNEADRNWFILRWS